MAQFGRPASDITSGGWVPSTGSDLFAMIDEVTPADGDYIEGGSTDTDAEVKLASVDDPGVGTGHIIRWRGQESGGGGAPERIDVGLYEGSTLIVEPWGNFAIASSFTTYEYTLLPAEADAISEAGYANLRIRFTVAALASGELLQVSWAELEVPDTAVIHTANAQLDGSGTVTALAEVVHQATSTLAGVGTIAAFPGTLTGYIQQYFRIRSGDTEGLNDDSGWAADENVNVTVGTGIHFRIRFKVRRIGVGTASTFKLQASFNSGAWTDVGVLLGAATPCVFSRPSTMFTDGDATSIERLTSTATYVNGEGICAATAGNILTASYDLDDQETEFEYLLQMLSAFSTPSRDQVQAGDTIEFRMVEGDGTVFPNAYTSPVVTVSETDGYVGTVSAEAPNRYIYFDETNDNVYLLIEDVENSPEICMFKSANRGATWRIMDDTNRPTVSDLESADMSIAGGIGYIGIQHDNNAYHHQFNFSDAGANQDTWQVTDELVKTVTARDDQTAAFVRRSNGDLVQFWQETVSTYEVIKYKIKNGSWGSEVTLDTEGTTHFTWATAVLGESDNIHIFYKDNTNGYIYHKMLNSSDSLGARESVTTDAGTSSSDAKKICPPIYYDASGVERIIVAVHDESSSRLYSSKIDDNGSPSTPVEITDRNVKQTTDTGSKQNPADLVVDGSDIYCIFADGANGEIWISKSVNYGTWGASSKIVADVDADYIQAFVFSPVAGGKHIGIYYENDSDGGSGQGWYTEYALSVIHTAGVILAGVSSITPLAEAVHQAIISFDGVGTFTSVGVLQHEVQSQLSGVGSVTPLAEVVHQAISQLDGTATLTATGTTEEGVTHTAQAQLDGVGNVVALAEVVHQALSQLNGVGNIIALAEVIHRALIQLEGTGNIAALAEVIHQTLSQLDGAGTLTAVGSVAEAGFVNGSSQLDGAGQVVSAGAMIYVSASQLDGVGALVGAGSWIRSSGGVLDGIGSLEAIGNLFKSGVVTFSGAGLVTSGGVVTYGGAMVVGGVATIGAIGFIVGGIPTAFTILDRRGDDTDLLHQEVTENLTKVK